MASLSLPTSRNTLFSVLVSVGVLFFWRGTWELMDFYIYPNDPELSGWVCLLAGYGIHLLCHVLGLKLVDPNTKLPKTTGFRGSKFVKLLHIFFLGVMTVFVWRGLWFLQDVYVIPTNFELSAWVSSMIGFILLACLGYTASILAPPAIQLSDEDSGIVFPFLVPILPSCTPTT